MDNLTLYNFKLNIFLKLQIIIFVYILIKFILPLLALIIKENLFKTACNTVLQKRNDETINKIRKNILLLKKLLCGKSYWTHIEKDYESIVIRDK